MQNFLSSNLLTKGLNVKIYINIVPTVVLYGYKSWSLALTEERRLRISENWVLKRILWPKREKITMA
jgi:hypothetical protein